MKCNIEVRGKSDGAQRRELNGNQEYFEKY